MEGELVGTGGDECLGIRSREELVRYRGTPKSTV